MARVYHKRSCGQVFLELVGVGQSSSDRSWTIWFIIAIILGLVANITVLISCIAPGTQPIYMFRTDDSNSTTNSTHSQFDIEGGTDYTYWGMSGTCTGTTSCTRLFPPPLLSNTTTTPSSAPKAAAALTILSTIISFALIILAILSLSLLRDTLRRWMLYALALVDAALFLGAGVLLISGSEGSVVGPGLFVLFAGVAFKLVAIPLLFCIAFIFFVLLFACVASIFCGDSRRDEVVVYVEDYHIDGEK